MAKIKYLNNIKQGQVKQPWWSIEEIFWLKTWGA